MKNLLIAQPNPGIFSFEFGLINRILARWPEDHFGITLSSSTDMESGVGSLL